MKPSIARGNSGLTLIELLVVLGIIAVLVLLTAPFVRSAMDRAYETACMENLSHIGVGILNAAADNNEYAPYSTYYNTDGTVNRFWTTEVGQYMGINLPLQVGQTVMRCPAEPPFNPSGGQNYTYGIDYGKISGGQPVSGNQGFYDGRIQPLTSVGSQVFLAADASALIDPIVYWPGPNGDWPLITDANHDGLPDSSSSATYNYVHFVHRHGTAANFLFVDGSVRSVTIQQWEQNYNGMWGTPWPPPW